ncbi:MAG: hypothetical protein P8Y80_16035 [Acidobacteriota bacterium]
MVFSAGTVAPRMGAAEAGHGAGSFGTRIGISGTQKNQLHGRLLLRPCGERQCQQKKPSCNPKSETIQFIFHCNSGMLYFAHYIEQF